jgi:hypothetical protein
MSRLIKIKNYMHGDFDCMRNKFKVAKLYQRTLSSVIVGIYCTVMQGHEYLEAFTFRNSVYGSTSLLPQTGVS